MKPYHFAPIPLLLAALMLCARTAGAAAPVGFNFESPADNDGGPPGYYTVLEGLDPTESAGAVPQTNWNNMTQGGTGVNVSVGGGIIINWVTPGGGAHALTSYFPPPPDFKLMRGYLDNSDNTSSPDVITVRGLKFALYDVICYTVGDNGSADRVGQFTLTATNNGVLFTNITKYVMDLGNSTFDGSTYTEANSTTGGPSTPAGNYCRFYHIRGTNLTVKSVGEYASDGHPRGPLNALQIIDLTPALSNPSYNNGQFQCSLEGDSNTTYVVEASANFVDWQPVSTNTGPAQITDSPPANPPYRFYRAQVQ